MLPTIFALGIALLTSGYINYLLLRDVFKVEIPDVGYTQSELFHQMKDHDDSFRHFEEQKERDIDLNVAIYNGTAYWIKDNQLTSAPIGPDDEILYGQSTNVDVWSMNDNEIDMITAIIDALVEEE